MAAEELDLNLIFALERLLETNSVTLAARELGVTQPAMSRTLGRLRDALGDPLFVREGRKLVPTARAKELAAMARAAVGAARRVFERPAPFDPATARGVVRIALGDEVQASFADAILTLLWRRAPGIDVRIRTLSIASIAESRRGDVDLAIAPDLSAMPLGSRGPDLSELVPRHLYDRRFVVVSSPRYPRRRLTLAAFAEADHLVVGPEASGRGFVDDLLEAMGYRRRVAAAITSFRTAAHVIAHTELIATLPDDVVRTAGVKLVIVRPPLELPVLPMNLLWHPEHTTDARHRFLRETVAQAVASRL